MGFVAVAAPVSGAVQMGLGAVAQTANLAFSGFERIIPDSVLTPALRNADAIVLQGDQTRRGAALVNRLVGRRAPEPVDYDAVRETRPLLASTTVDVATENDASVLQVRLTAENVDWSNADADAGHVAVYVDGRYHSNLLALAERDAPHRVNLAGLPPGRHVVELRAADDIVARSSTNTTVSGLAVRRLTGTAALVARFAPIIETRAPGAAHSGRERVLSSDVPLVMSPTVTPLPGGGTRITYDVLFSNEDGGVAIDQAYRHLGRTADLETAYRVDLDAAGNRIDDMFQGPVHVPYEFRGERVGDRPVLSVATRNNLFTSRQSRAAPRWSEAPTAAATERRSDRELLIQHRWTGAIMGKEVLREGKVTGVDAKRPVLDARRYLYLGPTDVGRQALKEQGVLHLQLKDGRTVPLVGSQPRVEFKAPFVAPLGTAVPLPAGIESSEIAGIRELAGTADPGETFVLDEAYRSRRIHLGLADAGLGSSRLG